MTLNELIEEARRKSRVSTIDQSDDVVARYINNGIEDFSVEVGGEYKSAALTPEARFYVAATEAFRVETDAHTATDVPLSATNLDGVNGDTFAAAIQTSLQSVLADATITVTWDESDKALTFTFPGVTGVTITAPDDDSYTSGIRYIGGAWQITGTTYTTATYLFYYTEADLPDDFIDMMTVWWGDKELIEESFRAVQSRVTAVEPTYYAIYGDIIRISPSPTIHKSINTSYVGHFPLFDLSEPLDTTQEVALPKNHELAFAFHAASLMAENEFEAEIADRMWARYTKHVSEYRRNIANDNARIGFKRHNLYRSNLRNERVNM